MKVKPVSRLYLTFEVDLDGMSVILMKDGKQGRTYDAGQYFQYFVEYGVRKIDVEQLKEHFSINYFQNMLVKGKGPDTFEFCIKFVGKDYKILECKMKVVENTSGNIIRINLEDISHKRLEQLDYIKEHSLELEYQPAAKPFDIKFEELSRKQQGPINKIRLAVIIMMLILSILYAIYIYDIYSQERDYMESAILQDCRTTSQMLDQQLDYSAKEVTALEDFIDKFGEDVTQKKSHEYMDDTKKKYGYDAIALLDENYNLVSSDKSLYNTFHLTEIVKKSVDQKFVLLNDTSGTGARYLNYSVYSDQLSVDGKKYVAVMALYDLSKICSVASSRTHYYDQEIMIADLDGNILWDNLRDSSNPKETNVLTCLSEESQGVLLGEKIKQIKGNMQAGKSGMIKFSCGGEQTLAAYTPLQVEGLYLFSCSTQNYLNAKNIHFIIQSILLWILILLLPSVMMIYVMKHTKKARKKLEELAYRDNITQGLNDNYFDEMASSAIKSMEFTYSLVLTNIVNFNIYNKKFGYMKGDEVIRRLFLGICKYIDEDELVCRSYADHMMILLKYETELRTEERIAEISKCLTGTGFKLEFGICIIRDSTMDLEVAKERASLALKDGKKSFSEYASWAFYALDLVEKICFEKELENTMYKAFRSGEFKINVEPRYSLEKRAVCGGDTYVIWKHPDKGVLRPELFMDIFERRGLVLCLDTYIFEEVCKKIKKHLDQGRDVMPICLKLHRSNFHFANSIEKFKRIKNRYDIPGKYIEFEITEQIFYEKISTIEKIIDCIHSMGCSCIMGNFGGGYLALNVLQQMKVDGIKLDTSCMSLPMSEKMVCAMVEIGKAMGVKTIAAGIMEEAQVRYLKKCCCDEGTGRVFSKTISLGEYINIF